MHELYKPYGMMVLPEGKESHDFMRRWVCTGKNYQEITDDCIPSWCPLSHSDAVSAEQPEPVYYPVTKAELNQIKNDCANPEMDSCDGCDYAGGADDKRASGIGCTFKGANILMDEVCARPPAKQQQKPEWNCGGGCCDSGKDCKDRVLAERHDAAVAAKAKAEGAKEERERVLKEVLYDLSAYKTTRETNVGEIEYVEWYCINKVILNTIDRPAEVIESLRSSKQESGP